MSDSEAQGTTSRGHVSANERDTTSPSRRESGSKHGSRRDRDRHDEHRNQRSRSHRHDRDRKERSNHLRDEEAQVSRSHRSREEVDDRHRSSAGSKRHREDQGRDEKRHRRHRDDGLHRSSKHSASRRGESDRSHKYPSSSSRCDRNEDPPRETSTRDHKNPARRHSRSRSPLPAASTSSHRQHTSSHRSPSSPQPVPESEPEPDPDAPNFAPSGLLAAESNTVNGVALKYHEPPEARKPKSPWRLYCFKDGKEHEVLHLGAQSAYLLGRDRTVVDIPLDHESCSKQHAVIQYRQTITTNEFGDKRKRIQPFLIDLESSNGSYVNDNEIPTSRYYQLRSGDTLTFGASTREYVLLDESSS